MPLGSDADFSSRHMISLLPSASSSSFSPVKGSLGKSFAVSEGRTSLPSASFLYPRRKPSVDSQRFYNKMSSLCLPKYKKIEGMKVRLCTWLLCFRTLDTYSASGATFPNLNHSYPPPKIATDKKRRPFNTALVARSYWFFFGSLVEFLDRSSIRTSFPSISNSASPSQPD